MSRVPQWRIVWWDALVWLSRRRPLSTLIQARTEELCESITILTQEMDVLRRENGALLVKQVFR